jgi:ATP-dependent helicase/nuclease subunit B
MLLPPLNVAPGAGYWPAAARGLLDALGALLPGRAAGASGSCGAGDLSQLRVVVPTLGHAQQLRLALSRHFEGAFLPPRICTMQAWLDQQQPDGERTAATVRMAGNQRLMALYAELRQYAWLKKLFTARRNTDLLPLAQTLLALSDELTAALWPAMAREPASAEARWDAALMQLPPTARAVLSDEAQLVWSVWKTQLDADDPTVDRLARMLALAAGASGPLVWVAPVAPDPSAQAFLDAWASRQPVLPILLDWRIAAIAPTLATAWPELVAPPTALGSAPRQPDLFEDSAAKAVGMAAVAVERRDEGSVAAACAADSSAALPDCLTVFPAASLEEEAQAGAQTVVDWLQQGKSTIAIVAQDRVVARRIRALLQRAGVILDDETGWKLSTTRAAAALAAWFDVVTSRAESTALLDFLKSPFLLAAADDKSDQVMAIELALRRHNVAGGWRAVTVAVPEGPLRDWMQQLATQAQGFRERHTIAGWLALTTAALEAFGIGQAYAEDAAGIQVMAMLELIGQACAGLHQEFSYAEWRACVSLQMEATPFRPPAADRRVVMLPLNGTHLRSFDAVLVVGADATHLPSAASEILFFANAVRRELGLPTAESRQLQQLRDFAELVSSNPVIVLSWQAHRNGEPNPVSNWIARLDLALARGAHPPLAQHQAALPQARLPAAPPGMPAPAAPRLLPEKLSASGYASLVACPYQFFATRMLGLSGFEQLSEQLEKRDYGDWLHRILDRYHTSLRDGVVEVGQRSALLQAITDDVFGVELAKSAAALGYRDRWQKAQPAYLEWANAREAEGWQFVAGEQWREHTLRWTGGEVLLHGRIDRIDANGEGEVAVLDYKTSSVTALRKKIDASEDHQLPFYGLLSAAPTASASYISLEPQKDKIASIAAPDYARWQRLLQQQIGNAMQAISEGAGLRASGVESVCQYCDVRGMCRKGAW